MGVLINLLLLVIFALFTITGIFNLQIDNMNANIIIFLFLIVFGAGYYIINKTLTMIRIPVRSFYFQLLITTLSIFIYNYYMYSYIPIITIIILFIINFYSYIPYIWSSHNKKLNVIIDTIQFIINDIEIIEKRINKISKRLKVIAPELFEDEIKEEKNERK